MSHSFLLSIYLLIEDPKDLSTPAILFSNLAHPFSPNLIFLKLIAVGFDLGGFRGWGLEGKDLRQVACGWCFPNLEIGMNVRGVSGMEFLRLMRFLFLEGGVLPSVLFW